LKVGAACSFSEWHTTMWPSRSITSASMPAVPATRDRPNGDPVVSARCAHATSRARARAAATAASSGAPSASSSRQQVESEATGPNNAG
jgi:hypothetical protein